MLSRPRGARLGAPEAPCSQVGVPVSLRGKRGRDGLGDPDLLRYGALEEGPERVALGSRAETGPRFLSSLLPSESSLLRQFASKYGRRPTCFAIPGDVSESLGTQTSRSESQGEGPGICVGDQHPGDPRLQQSLKMTGLSPSGHTAGSMAAQGPGRKEEGTWRPGYALAQ